jgi:NitT/TauT family transport system permease protein
MKRRYSIAKALKTFAYGRTIYGAAVILLLWYILHLTVNSNIIPSPYVTAVEFIRLIRGDMLLHVLYSFMRILAAVSISMILGVSLGLLSGMSKAADFIISPIAYILYPLPKIAFLPVFMILFGLGDITKIILITTIIFFQIMLATRDGVKEIPTELAFSVRSLGLNRQQTYIYLVFPSVLPKIISALRVSIGISIAALFFSENFATRFGIGYFIMNCWIMADYVRMFAGILTLSIMGAVIFKVIDLAEKALCPWIFLNEA